MSCKATSQPIFNFQTWRFEWKYRFKPRLFITLHKRNSPSKMPRGEDTYHWKIFLAPKTEFRGLTTGHNYHVKEVLVADSQEWVLEEKEAPIDPNDGLLVRLMFGKVLNETKVRECLRKVPIRHDEKDWNSVAWVKEAISCLADRSMDGTLGRAVLDWETIRAEAMRYVRERERSHRFDGTCEDKWDMTVVPTWCLLSEMAVCH